MTLWNIHPATIYHLVWNISFKRQFWMMEMAKQIIVMNLKADKVAHGYTAHTPVVKWEVETGKSARSSSWVRYLAACSTVRAVEMPSQQEGRRMLTNCQLTPYMYRSMHLRAEHLWVLQSMMRAWKACSLYLRKISTWSTLMNIWMKSLPSTFPFSFECQDNCGFFCLLNLSFI